MAFNTTQNGKNVKLPTLKDGRVNFAPGYRKDRAVTAKNITKGSLVIRERSKDRTLIKVTGVTADGYAFTGNYVTPTGKVVKEQGRTTFDFGKPVFKARPSH